MRGGTCVPRLCRVASCRQRWNARAGTRQALATGQILSSMPTMTSIRGSAPARRRGCRLRARVSRASGAPTSYAASAITCRSTGGRCFTPARALSSVVRRLRIGWDRQTSSYVHCMSSSGNGSTTSSSMSSGLLTASDRLYLARQCEFDMATDKNRRTPYQLDGLTLAHRCSANFGLSNNSSTRPA